MINVLHLGGLLLPVGLGVLDDTQGVNPDVSESQVPCDENGMLKCERHCGEWNGCLPVGEGCCCCGERLMAAPAVAEGDIVAG